MTEHRADTLVAGPIEPAKRARWKDWRALFGFLAPYMKDKKKRLGLALCAAIGVTMMKLLEPWPLKIIVDTYFFDLPAPEFLVGILPEQPETGSALLFGAILCVVLIAFLAGGFYYLQRLLISSLAMEATSALRVDVYKALLRQSPAYHREHSLGEKLNRLTGDIRTLRDSFVGMPLRLAESALLMVGMLIMMLLMNWLLALATLALLPFLLLVTVRLGRQIRRSQMRRRAREGMVAAAATEAFANLKVVQLLYAQKSTSQALEKIDDQGARAGLKSARNSAFLQMYVSIMLAATGACVIGLCAYLVLNGRLTPGDLLVFTAYLRNFFLPLRMTGSITERVSAATVAGARVFDVLDRTPEIDEPSAPRGARPLAKSLEFDNVTVTHRGGKPALRGVTLKIHAGERVVLTGSSGSGKSTLLSLIPRLAGPDQGSVLIDGRDLREVGLAKHRQHIAFLGQEPALFSMTVAENIAYGERNPSPHDIEMAVKNAGVQTILDALPQGLETRVGDKANRLSGGQKQSIAIARAVLRDAPILLLDEPTTGLDPELVDTVVDAILKLAKNRTIVAITHDTRIEAIATRTLRLSEGMVVSDLPSNQIRAAG